MANQEHLAMLKEAVRKTEKGTWNKWRQENPKIIPDLTGAKLQQAYLFGVDLSYANLSHANLKGAFLYRAELNLADLKWADLKLARLSEADLEEADLKWTDLQEADLSYAIIREANLREANLSGANLKEADIGRTQLLRTNLNSAILTGACIEDWNINSHTNLDNVICDYVYLKASQKERRPHELTKKFAPGEFTKLFQKALETVDLIFRNGIDWQVFLASFNQLQIEVGEQALSVQAIEKKKDRAFVIRVEVPSGADKAKIEESFWQKYKPMLQAKEEQIIFYREELSIKREENTRLIRIIKTMANQENEMLNKAQIKILQAIGNGVSVEREIAKALQIEKYLVAYYLEYFEKNNFIEVCYKGCTEREGKLELEYLYCQLTAKGKVAAENPSNLIKESTMIENRTIKTDTYYEQSGNVGIGHMSCGTIAGGAKVAGVIHEGQVKNLAEIAAEIQGLLNYFQEHNPTITEAQQIVKTATQRQPELQDATIIEAAIKANSPLKDRLSAASTAACIETVKILLPPVGVAIEAVKAWNNPE